MRRAQLRGYDGLIAWIGIRDIQRVGRTEQGPSAPLLGGASQGGPRDPRRVDGTRLRRLQRAPWSEIEPLDEDGIYARFLAEKGEGVHHVAVATPDFDETVARAERKAGLMLRCEHSGIDIAYLDTQRDLGVILEVFSGMPSNGGDPDST
jgi:hypothetical protein